MSKLQSHARFHTSYHHSPLETEDRAHFSNSLETGRRRHLGISADISAGIGARWNLYVSIPPLVRRGANPLCSTSFLHLEERKDVSANIRAAFPVKHRYPSSARTLGTNLNGLQLRDSPGFCWNLTASSVVNLPLSDASLRLVVIRMESNQFAASVRGHEYRASPQMW
jgi:hypothetical protein